MAPHASVGKTRRVSFSGRLVMFVTLLFAATLLAAILIGRALSPWWLGYVVGLLLALPILAFAIDRWLQPAAGVVEALTNGADSLRDADFSVTIAAPRDDELADLVAAHNRLGQALRLERQTLYQRELLLDTVIQTTDIALVLCNARGRIVYSNTAARQLLNAGRPVNGEDFKALADALPRAISDAVQRGGQGLFTIDADEPQTYHLSCNEFMLNAQRHSLYLLKQLTQELKPARSSNLEKGHPAHQPRTQ